LLSLEALMIVVAALAWLSYVGNGIAYGSIVGLPGRERDLAAFGAHALVSLAVAVVCEAVAVGIALWMFMPEDGPLWARLCFASLLAGIADLLTFAAVRGF
jgi:hypothetical protein